MAIWWETDEEIDARRMALVRHWLRKMSRWSVHPHDDGAAHHLTGLQRSAALRVARMMEALNRAS